MTKEEYLKAVKEKQSEIAKLESEIKILDEEYCKDCAPFKIGDKIRIKGKEGVISSVRVWYNEFEYNWRPFRKNGSEGAEKKIWSFDIKNIEKV